MSNPNTVENFERAFNLASQKSPQGVTYSHIFRAMEEGQDGYANPDFVNERIQAGINDGTIHCGGYAILDEVGNVESTFAGLANEPDEAIGRDVVPVYL